MITFQNGELFYDGEKVKPGFSFSQAMWQARLDGRKTVMRRPHKKPIFDVGDRIYVKEPLVRAAGIFTKYEFDGEQVFEPVCPLIDSETNKTVSYVKIAFGWRWQRDRLSARYMPADATRFVDRIIDVRQERLQEIADDEFIEEGIVSWVDFSYDNVNDYRDKFIALWNSIYPKQPWASNPPVTVYEWKVII